jgi:hypothetical protein
MFFTSLQKLIVTTLKFVIIFEQGTHIFTLH